MRSAGIRNAALALGALLITWPGAARAVPVYEATDLTNADVGGDVKTFFVGIYPYEHDLMPEDPLATGIVDMRLKTVAGISDWLTFTLHQDLTASALPGLGGAGLGFSATGSEGGDPVPQIYDLTWAIEDGAGYGLNLRVDRAALSIKVPHVDLTLGRQPVSFGSSYFFNPMDLVAPFSPTVIDREYKPGVDALRLDAYFGTSGKVTLVSAWVGEAWDRDTDFEEDIELADFILAGHGSLTLGTWDLGVFVGEVREDTVVGLDTVGDLFGLAVQGELTLTFVEGETEPYLRGALGANYMTDFGLTVMGEFYAQGQGAEKPSGYIAVTESERYKRGEFWALGRYYGALSVSYELLPIVNVGFFTVANLTDDSALLGPSLSWSISDEAALGLGGYFGVGKRPERINLENIIAREMAAGTPPDQIDPSDYFRPRSEFGMMPAGIFMQLSAYF